MNVLFLTLANITSINDSNIYTDLFREFIRNNHKVYIVSPYEKRYHEKTQIIKENMCNILKVKIGNIQKTNIIEKGISTLLIERQFIKAIKNYFNDIKFDVIIYSTPPITFEKVIRFIKSRDNAKSYLMLKDIFPQNAVDLNMLSSKNPIYWYFRKKEKNLYKCSDYIGCMSQANVDFILKNNLEIMQKNVEVCPNSIEPIEIKKDENQIKEIRLKYNIPINKTVFIYGGNLGKPQGIDFFIECLKSNIDNEKVYFLIVGSGTEFKKLKAFLDNVKPCNIQLISQLPKKDYDMLVKSCDVGLILLDRRFTIPNFPSRILSYMQASIPVLAATDINTDIGVVIHEGDFGFWCESNNVEEFNKYIEKLCDTDIRKRQGANGRKYLEDNYTVKHTYKIIMKHFQ